MIEGKDPRLLVRSVEPLNAEPPRELLAREFLTPTSLFFVRNHTPAPTVDAASHRLSVGGLVRNRRQYTLDELRRRFREVTLAATLQCAGNRRLELAAVRPIEGEIPWDAQAIGTAEWTGVRLRDVLEDAGIARDAAHVEFTGRDEIEKEGRVRGFGGSIPLGKAVSDEVLLAHGMNGSPLTRLHGHPLRAVVPGYIGARSVKWLSTVTVRSDPSDNYYQRHAYRMFPPHASAETANWDAAEMLGEVGVNAVILTPGDGERVPAGSITVRGYAVAGRHTIQRVEVSPDGGDTWIQAELDQRHLDPLTWRLWQATVPLGPGTHQLIARGMDSAGGHQPEDPASVWNFKGYMNTARHRITVRTG